jgi:hypothetical protein
MAVRGVTLTVSYTAWNTATGRPQQNDAANHTLKTIRDGVEAPAVNAPADSSGIAGECKLVLTAAEMVVDFITLGGASTTPNVILIPVKITTEHGIMDLLQADQWVDRSTTPWNLVYIKKGTGALGVGVELLRQVIKDTAGSNLVTDAQVPGSLNT